MGRTLVCAACGAVRDDDRYLPLCCGAGVVRVDYGSAQPVRDDLAGVWRYLPWLPIDRPGPFSVRGVTYRSEGLARSLGLDELWISFHGYWPERGADCPTCTFKDPEAAVTLQRLVEFRAPGVVVASAGNTARSLVVLGGEVGLPVLAIVAEQHLERIWSIDGRLPPSSVVVGLRGADYNDAIDLAGDVSARLGFEREGGVKSVARRDGIGVLVVDATIAIGQIPRHYVQAVGGGPGPIGVWDMAKRLHAAGWPGELPVLHLAQNTAHAPVHRAWSARRRQPTEADVPSAPRSTFADVLVNRAPAYGLPGGLFDALTESRGRTYVVEQPEARQAGERFAELEGIDIDEAAMVATAALGQAVRGGAIGRDEPVLLAITGGGRARLAAEHQLEPARPDLVVDLRAAGDAIVAHMAERVALGVG